MRIGRYEVCGLLGRGGMGAVYKVRQPVTGRIAALKLLRPAGALADMAGMTDAADPAGGAAMNALRARFLHEACVMAALDHPHVAAVWDVDVAPAGTLRLPSGDDLCEPAEAGCDPARLRAERVARLGDLPFFVMEYYCLNLGLLIGESYRVEAPTRRLPLPRACRYASQTLDALARMHHAGVVHRDVKPFNLMITAEDDVKLIDFGLSRVRGETRALAHLHGEGAPLPRGARVGSPYYAAPEQERDPEGADGRADLFAVGVMLFRMLTGVLPTDEAFGGRIPGVGDHGADMGGMEGEWDAFFARALAPDPAGRFDDARGMATELTQLAEAWQRRKDAVCALPEALAQDFRKGETGAGGEGARGRHAAGEQAVAPATCRSEPLKVAPRHARETFGLDALWRPVARWAGAQPPVVPHAPVVPDTSAVPDAPVAQALPVAIDPTAGRGLLVALGPLVAYQPATGLMWQRGGSEWGLTRAEALAHVEALNAAHFAGFADWRLPTVDEACTLIALPAAPDGHCVPPLLDPAADPLWTADRKSFMASWFVGAHMGFVGWQDDTCRFYVRVVRTA